MIVFVLVLLAVSALVFFEFSHYQRAKSELRRKASVLSLLRLEMLLEQFAQAHNGQYPAHASAILETAATDLDLSHPSWPEQSGYVYVTGIRLSDEPATIVIYENVPERKRKLGFQVLRVSGKVDWLSQDDFAAALRDQEERWSKKGRVWKPEEMVRAQR